MERALWQRPRVRGCSRLLLPRRSTLDHRPRTCSAASFQSEMLRLSCLPRKDTPLERTPQASATGAVPTSHTCLPRVPVVHTKFRTSQSMCVTTSPPTARFSTNKDCVGFETRLYWRGYGPEPAQRRLTTVDACKVHDYCTWSWTMRTRLPSSRVNMRSKPWRASRREIFFLYTRSAPGWTNVRPM